MTTKSKQQQDKHKMSEIDENISKMFDIKKRLGKGAYGIVWKALDKRTNETLAVKKIFDAFRDETDAQRTFREIIFLKAFRNHPNIVKLHTVYKASNNLDIYLIFEYMESDLHNIIKKGTILKDIHKRYVMYQLINAIKYIHSGNVIHRDLKPSNVLIDSKCRCKLADFGLARSVSNRPMRDNNSDMNSEPVAEPLLTDYVATRWYRAPEILVASKRYTKGIDMWSLGCILGEMIRGKPLFQGSSTVNQIEKIVTALPDITEHDINAVGAGFGSVLLSKQISRERKISLDELLTEAPDDAIDLVKSLLVLDPLARLNAKQALGHSYVEKFRNSIAEIELNFDILPPFRDDVRFTVPEYRSKLYEIVQSNSEKTEKRQHMGTNRNTTKHKDRDHKYNSSINNNMSHERIEPTMKKSHKTKHHSHADDKHTGKDKYISRPEKHETETQPSVSVPSITDKLYRKSSVSPDGKRKSGGLQPRNNQSTIDQQRLSTMQPTDDNVTSYPLHKAKNHLHAPASHDELVANCYYDKRHSMDGGYDNMLDGGGGGGDGCKQPSLLPHSSLKKTGPAQRLHRSSSALQGDERRSHHARRHDHSREGLHSSSQHQTLPGHSKISNLSEKAGGVRNTKSEGVGLNISSENKQERICYEKRLKKLEEEIEKYKKEVKSFCKESFSNTNQQQPLQNPSSQPSFEGFNQSQYHYESQGQNLIHTRSNSHGHIQTHLSIHSNMRSHTPTRISHYHLQQKLEQKPQQQPQYLIQQQPQQNRSSQSNNSKSDKQYNATTTTSLPVMMTASTPKKDPYFQLLAKSSRDFAKAEYIKGNLMYIQAADNNIGKDLSQHPINPLNGETNHQIESKHQRRHSHSQHNHHPHPHPHHQSQHQQQQRQHQQPQQQQQKIHQHQQQQQQQPNQQSNRSISKFRLRSQQLGEHNTKAFITNYQ